jgi:16S rRNA (uracil1498-N3)-methyltransferase
MTAPHFFAPSVDDERVTLAGEEARHATRVLRVRVGEEITVSDGSGNVVRAVVEEAGATLVARAADRWTEPRPRPAIHVFQAIPKGRKLDLVVQKLTELGVDVFRPFPAARSVSEWDDKKARAQTERLAAIAREAAKQSRRAWLPAVLPPEPLEDVELPSFTVVLDEEATLRMHSALPDESPEPVGIVVGPEGGFDRSEIAALALRGAIPVSLGPLVLRTETAGFAALAVAGVRYGRLG